MQALNGIIDLCYNEPFLRDLFFELSGVNILQEVHTSSDTDHLLSSSRKALVFLSDAQVSSLFSELRYRPGVTEKQYTELTGHLLLVFFFSFRFSNLLKSIAAILTRLSSYSVSLWIEPTSMETVCAFKLTCPSPHVDTIL